MRDLALNCFNALLLSIVLISLMGRFSTIIGLVDVPAGRKRHNGHIPLVGTAVFAAFAVETLLIEHWPAGYGSFLLGLFLLVVLGVVDDLYDVRAAIKLFVQTACAGLMVLPTEHFVRHVGFLPPDYMLPLVWAIPVTILAMVGMINAINMMDGIDGLAGSITLVLLFWFAVAASGLGLTGEFSISVLAAVCVVGFLGFNLRHPWRSRAGVFLGDAGSTMLGAIVGFLAIAVSQTRTGNGLSPLAVVWICFIPVVDTLSLAVRRLKSGRSPFSSDRLHLHHLVLEAGFTEGQAVTVISGCSAILGGIGIAGWALNIPDSVMLAGLVVPLAIHIWFTSYGPKHLRTNWEDVSLPDATPAPRSAE